MRRKEWRRCSRRAGSRRQAAAAAECNASAGRDAPAGRPATWKADSAAAGAPWRTSPCRSRFPRVGLWRVRRSNTPWSTTPRPGRTGWAVCTRRSCRRSSRFPAQINAPYQPPPQALKLVLETGKSTRDVQVISECPVVQAVPELSQLIQQMQSQGFQVDARLIHVQFRNVPTGLTCRGLFSVICSIKPTSPIWQVSVQGSWAPDKEYEEWLPLYLRVEKTVQVNQQWMSQEMQNQAVRQQQLNPQSAEIHRGVESCVRRLHELGPGRRAQPRLHQPHVEPDDARPGHLGRRERRAPRSTRPIPGASKARKAGSTARPTTRPTSPARTPGPAANWTLVNTRAEYEKYIANQ